MAKRLRRRPQSLTDVSSGLRIANGRTRGDMDGIVTYASAQGSSVPDYVLAGPATMPLIADMHVLPAPVSDHHAIQCNITLPRHFSSPNHPPTHPQTSTPPPRMRGAKEIEAWLAHLGRPDITAEVASIMSTAE